MEVEIAAIETTVDGGDGCDGLIKMRDVATDERG
jgi:hypothetical protein